MLSVKDIMSSDPVTVSPDTDIFEAAKTLIEKKINGMPVVDAAGKLVGVLTQSDLIHQQARIKLPSVFTLLGGFVPLPASKDLEDEMEKMAALTVGEAMSEKVVSVTPETSIQEVADIMLDDQMHTLPVVDGGKLVGIVGKEDVLRSVLASAGK
jgi:CBS domain-containing protein